MPEFCTHFARRWIHLHSGKRRFLLIFGCAQNRKLYERYSQIVTSITFFSRSRKKLKKHDTGIQMTTKWIIFLRPNFILIFQKIHQTSPITRFFQRKNASKSDENYAFWVASRTIHIPRSGFQTGAQNHAKLLQNATQITAKWAWKNMNSGRAMLKNARRRPTCKIASKRVRFCRYRCCFAHAMHAKIAQNHWNFTIKSSQKVRMP